MGGTIATIVALLLAGLVLLLLEVLTPAFGLLAAGAIAALAAAVWVSFTLSSELGMVMIVAAVVGVPAYLVCLVKVLPKTRLGRRLFLRKAAKATGQGTPEAGELKRLIGRTGRAETPLRPSGAVRIDGRRLIAIAESGMIEQDTTVRVIGAGGTELIVRPIKPAD